MAEAERTLTAAEQEMAALGMLGPKGEVLPHRPHETAYSRPSMTRLSAAGVLCEAFHYDKPSSFSRGVTLEFPQARVLLLSGTASVGQQGQSLYPGDFEAQVWRTYRNLTELLREGGMDWHHVVFTANFLKDIQAHYEAFNRVRTRFFTWLGLDPLPASVGVQATLCRPELLVEIALVAVGGKE